MSHGRVYTFDGETFDLSYTDEQDVLYYIREWWRMRIKFAKLHGWTTDGKRYVDSELDDEIEWYECVDPSGEVWPTFSILPVEDEIDLWKRMNEILPNYGGDVNVGLGLMADDPDFCLWPGKDADGLPVWFAMAGGENDIDAVICNPDPALTVMFAWLARRGIPAVVGGGGK